MKEMASSSQFPGKHSLDQDTSWESLVKQRSNCLSGLFGNGKLKANSKDHPGDKPRHA
jgi:hypothetical protein